MVQGVDRRRYPRRDVELSAQLRLSGCLIDGTIRDCSVGGYFFYPEVGYFCGRFVQHEEALDILKEGDKLEISVFSSPNKIEFVSKIEVKWGGLSKHHNCYGLGLQNAADQLSMRNI